MAFSSVLSDTLQSITVTEIGALEKLVEKHIADKAEILDQVNDESKDARERVYALLDGMKDMPNFSVSQIQNEHSNIRHWLAQAAYDPSVSDAKILALEHELRSQLDKGSRKLDLAHLYSRLLTEWIYESQGAADPEPEDLAKSDSDNSYEVIEDTQKARLEQLRNKFARVVFEPLETDEVEIDIYLNQLFDGDHGTSSLERLRKEVSRYGKTLIKNPTPFDDQSLRWCIKALLKNDMLNDEKKASLNDFLKDEAVLSEIKDVLNMRFRDLKVWEWNLGDDGMPVVPRQSLNGKWRVMIDEDVLQALLTHHIGTCWAVNIKKALVSIRRSGKLWKKNIHLPEEERAKLAYYFGSDISDLMVDNENVAYERLKTYDDDFFMSPLPSKFFEEAVGYDDDDDDDDVPTSDKKSPKDIKQLLLRTLATEVIMRRSLDGEVAVVQSDFQWFSTGIAHSTIFAVMRFVGFEKEWITFFQKVLEPPLNMLDGNPVRTRKRGLPMAHIFEKFLGELVLFFMDLAVARNDGMILYRFHDDLWLAGKPSLCAASWKTMEQFAKVMGLDFNKNKTGSVYLTDGSHNRDASILKSLPEGPVVMNFLVLDPESGAWVINQEHVQAHVKQLQKQLNTSKSVLQWIKTWNSCIGRFFSYTFGEPANCFGLNHVDKILRTHQDMQKSLFNDETTGDTVTKHIKHMISSRSRAEDVPDSFIFMSESLGGLGLKNPFITLLLLRADICKDPDQMVVRFQEVERKGYNDCKKQFENLTEKERRKRYRAAFQAEEDEGTEPPISWKDAQVFMSFEEFTKYRECISPRLHDVYTSLLRKPSKDRVYKSDRVQKGLRALARIERGLEPKNVNDTDWEMLWLVQYFEDELFDKYGGLEVVDKGLLPMGVLKALRARKITWNMVL